MPAPWRNHPALRAGIFRQASGTIWRTASAPTTGYPVSLFCWALVDEQVSGTTHRLMALGITSNATQNQVSLVRNTVGIFGMSASATSQTATNETTTSPRVGRWTAVGATFTSDTDRTLYLNGLRAATSTTSRVPSGQNALSLGGAPNDTLTCDHRLLLPSLWNVALTQAEHMRLARGAMPWEIRRGLLASYPDLGTGIDYTGAFAASLVNSAARVQASTSLPPVLTRHQRVRQFWWVPGTGGITLTVADATHSHAVDSVALTQANALVVSDATHAHAADTLALVQAHLLAVADAAHAHTADNADLTQANTLAVAEAAHAHSADNVALTQAHILAVADALHAHAVDNLELGAGYTLAVGDAAHGHAVDTVELTQASVLVVQETAHGHLVDAVELGFGVLLEIADALHAHAADEVALTQAHLLAVQGATHGHSADTVGLTQASVLIVSDALHAHLADVLSLKLPGAFGAHAVFVVSAGGRTIVVAAENRLAVVAPSERIFTVPRYETN